MTCTKWVVNHHSFLQLFSRASLLGVLIVGCMGALNIDRKIVGIRKADAIKTFSIISLFVEDFSYLRKSDFDHIDLFDGYLNCCSTRRDATSSKQASKLKKEQVEGLRLWNSNQDDHKRLAQTITFQLETNIQYGSLGQLAQQELFNKSRIFINSSTLRVLPTVRLRLWQHLIIVQTQHQWQQGNRKRTRESQSRKVSNIPSWWV